MIIISPAKNLDFSENQNCFNSKSSPSFLEKTNFLVKKLKTLSCTQIKNLMKISDKLSELNKDRFNNFSYKFNDLNTRQAIFAFKGDTYKGLNINSFNESEIKVAQKRLRILSGLYGILKPLDLIQPYRLEMGSNVSSVIGEDLYGYWSEIVTNRINDEMKKSKNKYLINLASVEYAKVINKNKLNFEVINPVFLQKKNEKLLNIGIISKRARGMMASYLLKNNLSSFTEIKTFNIDGYKYDSIDKNDNKLFFIK